MPDFAWVAAAIAALGGIITAVATLRRANEDAAAGASARWAKLVDALTKSNADLLKRVNEMEAEMDERNMLRESMQIEIREQANRIKELQNTEELYAEKLKALSAEHELLKTNMKRLALRVEYYRRIVSTLLAQLKEHGIEPAIVPDDEENKEQL